MAHVAKAYALNLQSRREEAIVEAERSLALNPSFMDAYGALCSANLALARPDQCLELMDKAIRLSPRDPYLWLFFFFREYSYFMKGQYDQSIYWARRGVAITPQVEMLLDLSSALALTGHQAEAHEMLKRYLALGNVHTKTIAQLRIQLSWRADNPAQVEYFERLFAGLRKAGMPEE